MPVTGDFGKLAAWEKLLESGDTLVRPMAEAMAEELLDLTKQRFRTETDPYGKPWEPKQRSDGRKVLSGETSRLKGGWHVTNVSATGFEIAPSVEYAVYHQSPRNNPLTGRLNRPQRMMVPSSAKGLPQEYSQALREVAMASLGQWFGGGGGRGSSLISSAMSRLGIKQIIKRAIKLAESSEE